MDPIRETLEQTGINTAALDRIRLARGVVGKASYVAGAAILVMGAISLKLSDPLLLLLVAGLVLAIFALYFGGTLWFANRHPGLALLEGAELIQWRRLDMIAKSGARIESPPILPGPESEGSDTK